MGSADQRHNAMLLHSLEDLQGLQVHGATRPAIMSGGRANANIAAVPQLRYSQGFGQSQEATLDWTTPNRSHAHRQKSTYKQPQRAVVARYPTESFVQTGRPKLSRLITDPAPPPPMPPPPPLPVSRICSRNNRCGVENPNTRS